MSDISNGKTNCKIWRGGWVDGSVEKVLAWHLQGPEFVPGTVEKKEKENKYAEKF